MVVSYSLPFPENWCQELATQSAKSWYRSLEKGCLNKSLNDKPRLFSRLKFLTRHPAWQASILEKQRLLKEWDGNYKSDEISDDIDSDAGTEEDPSRLASASPVILEDFCLPPSDTMKETLLLLTPEEFFEFLSSDKFTGEKSLRVMGGKLLCLLLSSLVTLEKQNELHSHVIHVNLKNRWPVSVSQGSDTDETEKSESTNKSENRETERTLPFDHRDQLENRKSDGQKHTSIHFNVHYDQNYPCDRNESDNRRDYGYRNLSENNTRKTNQRKYVVEEESQEEEDKSTKVGKKISAFFPTPPEKQWEYEDIRVSIFFYETGGASRARNIGNAEITTDDDDILNTCIRKLSTRAHSSVRGPLSTQEYPINRLRLPTSVGSSVTEKIAQLQQELEELKLKQRESQDGEPAGKAKPKDKDLKKEDAQKDLKADPKGGKGRQSIAGLIEWIADTPYLVLEGRGSDKSASPKRRRSTVIHTASQKMIQSRQSRESLMKAQSDKVMAVSSAQKVSLQKLLEEEKKKTGGFEDIAEAEVKEEKGMGEEEESENAGEDEGEETPFYKRLFLSHEELTVTGLYLPSEKNKISTHRRLTGENKTRQRERLEKSSDIYAKLAKNKPFDLSDRFKGVGRRKEQERIKGATRKFKRRYLPDKPTSADISPWDSWRNEEEKIELGKALDNEVERKVLQSLIKLKKLKKLKRTDVVDETVNDKGKAGKKAKTAKNGNNLENIPSKSKKRENQNSSHLVDFNKSFSSQSNCLDNHSLEVSHTKRSRHYMVNTNARNMHSKVAHQHQVNKSTSRMKDIQFRDQPEWGGNHQNLLRAKYLSGSFPFILRSNVSFNILFNLQKTVEEKKLNDYDVPKHNEEKTTTEKYQVKRPPVSDLRAESRNCGLISSLKPYACAPNSKYNKDIASNNSSKTLVKNDRNLNQNQTVFTARSFAQSFTARSFAQSEGQNILTPQSRMFSQEIFPMSTVSSRAEVPYSGNFLTLLKGDLDRHVVDCCCWECKSQKDALAPFLPDVKLPPYTYPYVLGKLRSYNFLKNKDKHFTPELRPRVTSYFKDLEVKGVSEKLLSYFNEFVIRKEILSSSLGGTHTTVTFTRPEVFQRMILPTK